jgi:hypothetical protein
MKPTGSSGGSGGNGGSGSGGNLYSEKVFVGIDPEEAKSSNFNIIGKILGPKVLTSLRFTSLHSFPFSSFLSFPVDSVLFSRERSSNTLLVKVGPKFNLEGSLLDF